MTRSLYYILDARTGRPMPCRSVRTWARWMECVSNAKVRQDRLQLPRYGEVMVSTIFMGLDHNESGRGNPVLWETAVLGMPNDMTRKFSSREEALRYHDELLQVLPAAYLPVTFRPASSPIEHALLN